MVYKCNSIKFNDFIYYNGYTGISQSLFSYNYRHRARLY